MQTAISYTYTVSDSDSNTAETDEDTLTFTITIVAVAADSAPSFGSESVSNQSYTVDSAISTLTLPAATGGNGTLSYSLAPTSGQGDLPAGLSFDTSTRQLSGTPSAVQSAISYTYTVSDSDSNTTTADEDSLAFNITVEAADTVPAKPTNLSATASNEQVTLSWQAGVDGGSAIIRYEYQQRESGGSYGNWTEIPNSGAGQPNSTRFTVVGLTNGTTYYFQVRAVNSVGDSAASDAASATPGLSVPLKPLSLTATPGNRLMTLTWPAITNGGSPVTKHQVLWKEGEDSFYGWVDIPDSAEGETNTQKYIVFGLKNDTVYRFQLRAWNALGAGDPSDEVAAAPSEEPQQREPTARLSATPNPVAEGTPVTVMVALSLPLASAATIPLIVTANTAEPEDFGSLESIVILSGQTMGTGTLTTAIDSDEDDETFTLALGTLPSPLVPGDPSEVTVTIRDGTTPPPSSNRGPVIDGEETLSVEVKENTAGGTEFGNVFIATDPDGDDIEWRLGGVDAALFRIVANPAGHGQLTLAGGTVLDHESRTRYAFTVEASDGSLRDTVAVTVNVTDIDEPPLAPETPEVHPTSSTSLTVAWRAPDNAGRPVIVAYDLRYCVSTNGCEDPSAWRDWPADGADSTSTAATIGNLQSDTVYYVQVRAENDEGVGPWSVSGEGRTDRTKYALVLSRTEFTVVESGAESISTYTIALATSPSGPVTVRQVSGDANVVMVAPASLTFTVDDWSVEQTVTVTGVDDAIDNDGRSTTIVHSASGGGYDDVESVAVAVSLTDDEDEPTVTLVLEPASVSENGGVARVTASLDRGSSEDTVIEVSALPVAPAVVGDFRLSGNTKLRVAAGQAESAGEVTLTAMDDFVATTEKTVRVSGSASNGEGIEGPADVLLTIVENDVQALLTSTSSVTVTESGSGSSAAYTLRLGSEPTGPVTVRVVGDAAGIVTVAPNSLTFTAEDWNVEKTVMVMGIDDDLANGERMTAIRHSASGGGYDGVDELVVQAILVDDEHVNVWIGSASAPEGDAGLTELAFDVRLSVASTFEIALAWATVDDTATAVEDYAAGSGILRFAPGDTVAALAVQVYGDELPEQDETFRVILSDAHGGILGETQAEGTILDDDLAAARGVALEGALAGLGRSLGADAVDAVTGRLEAALQGSCRQFDNVPAVLGFSMSDSTRYDTPVAVGGVEGWSDNAGYLVPSANASQQVREMGQDGQCSGGLGLWGRVTASSFQLDSAGQTSDGRLTTGYLGADWLLGDDLLVGIALSRNWADLNNRTAEAIGVEADGDTSLTGILPYAQWRFERGSFWALLGAGDGDVELSDQFGEVRMDLSQRLAAAGVRRELNRGELDGLRLAIKGDVFATSLATNEGEGLLPESDADATRIRLLLEGGSEWSRSESSSTSLSLEAGGRWDSGTAGSGGGGEVGLSLSHRRPAQGLEVRAEGRYVVLHAAEHFEDQSLSLAFSLDPGARGHGARFSLAPTWGAVGGGAMSWLTGDTSSMAGLSGPTRNGGADRESWWPSRFEAEWGYGWTDRRGRLLDLYGGATGGGWIGRQFHLGWRMTLSEWLGLTMELELTRQHRDDAPARDGVQLRIRRVSGIR